jgi:hypothetical protein
VDNYILISLTLSQQKCVTFAFVDRGVLSHRSELMGHPIAGSRARPVPASPANDFDLRAIARWYVMETKQQSH